MFGRNVSRLFLLRIGNHMALALPYTLVAGQPENVNQLQSNLDTLAAVYPLENTSANFAAVPQVAVTHSTSQVVAAGAVIVFNTELWDTGTAGSNMHDTV